MVSSERQFSEALYCFVGNTLSTTLNRGSYFESGLLHAEAWCGRTHGNRKSPVQVACTELWNRGLNHAELDENNLIASIPQVTWRG
jgi:hypothetical protein